MLSEAPRASQATMVATSWIKDLKSRAFVEGERNWESFAFMQGWFEMCTFGGRLDDSVAIVRR